MTGINVLHADDYQICALDKDGSPCFSVRGSASPEIDLQLLSGLSYSDKTADFKDKGRSISAVQTVSDYNGWNWYLIQPSSTLYYSAENYQRLSIVLIILTVLLESGFIVLLTAYNSRSVADLSSELERSCRSISGEAEPRTEKQGLPSLSNAQI